MNLKAVVDLEDVVVNPATTMLQAMEVLHKTGLEVVLVCDAHRVLLAVVTDGDLRAAILEGKHLDAPLSEVGNPRFTSVGVEISRHAAIQMMVERGFKCLPVIDKKRRLVDLHTLGNAIRVTRCANWAVIMAGGKGERLGDLTQGIPKPMLPVGDRPILEHIVNLLVSHGISRIFLSVNYLGQMICDHFEDGRRFACQIEYLHETQPLGTGGPLGLLPERPRDPLLVMNGDLLTNINITRLLQFHRAGNSVATMVVRDHVVQVPFGVAEVEEGQLTKLIEKPSLKYKINTGIYVLEPELLARIPKDRAYPITELFAGCIAEQRAIGAFPLQEEWHDIGLPIEYERVQAQRARRKPTETIPERA